jgi:glycosyltransferase involved in cell wall biosynthesis
LDKITQRTVEKKMIPIGIVTYNRAQFLDITLKSLSATKLPKDQIVVVFDDASNDDLTRRYLYTNDKIDLSMLSMTWPVNDKWYDTDLNIINAVESSNVTGIRCIIDVVRLGSKRQHIVNASCDAIRRLYKMFNSEEVILVQDDVVFNVDWFDRLCYATKIKKNPPPGLVVGMTLNNSKTDSKDILINRHYYTAQCFFITSKGKKAIYEWINSHHNFSTEFDNRFVGTIRKGGTGAYLINPPVCQHFGITSQIRPGKRGWPRIDCTSKGPYVIADDIRNFVLDR